MLKLKTVLLSALLITVLMGCGSKDEVVKGDRFVVTEEMSKRAELHRNSDGFRAILPKGTVLQVVATPRAAAGVMEVVPVEMEGNTDTESVMDSFIPENIRRRYGDVQYIIGLSKDYIGTKIEKIEE
ncbi:hypothetical protein QA601_03150 [Chitinispirillales bacterium ANBcel5]|uniref:hypothetical protein n=1 Tax=Cellulosispirillum alkaliphilum TaxID=3039283 RepID=UPI002A4E3BFE|nr:hypothetical protein [Chitinispirillales bacterium ANBcel5]